MVDLPIYNKDSEVRFMDNERHVCWPVEFNKALIGEEFMYFDVEGELLHSYQMPLQDLINLYLD